MKTGLILEFANEAISQIWGKAGAKSIKARSIKGSVIKIECENSIMAQEVKLKSSQLLEIINKKFRTTNLRKTRIVQKGIDLDEY